MQIYRKMFNTQFVKLNKAYKHLFAVFFFQKIKKFLLMLALSFLISIFFYKKVKLSKNILM